MPGYSTAPPPTLADVARAARALLHHERRADHERDLLAADVADLTLADHEALADVAYASADACVARADLESLLDALDVAPFAGDRR